MYKAIAVTSKHINQKTVYTFLSILLVALMIFWSSAFAGSPSQFYNQETKVKGTWMIEERVDGNYLVLSEDFKTKNAPDLKFFVSKNGFRSITNNNATKDAVEISKLYKNKGKQSYKIPQDIILDDYQSLVLHCEEYSKLWASTPLKE